MSQNTDALVEDFYALMNIPITKKFGNDFQNFKKNANSSRADQ